MNKASATQNLTANIITKTHIPAHSEFHIHFGKVCYDSWSEFHKSCDISKLYDLMIIISECFSVHSQALYMSAFKRTSHNHMFVESKQN